MFWVNLFGFAPLPTTMCIPNIKCRPWYAIFERNFRPCRWKNNQHSMYIGPAAVPLQPTCDTWNEGEPIILREMRRCQSRSNRYNNNGIRIIINRYTTSCIYHSALTRRTDYIIYIYIYDRNHVKTAIMEIRNVVMKK